MSSRKTSLQTLVATVLFAPLLVGAAGPDTFRNGESIYGQPATTMTTRTGVVVDVTAAKHINVNYGDTVVFVNGDKRFVWTFNGLDRVRVKLGKIAPADFGTASMTVHVGQDPLQEGR
jgi:hypothetical protein